MAGELSGYEEIVSAIASSSMTQSPALLAVAVKNAIDKKAFNGAGGLMGLVCCVVARARPETEPRQRYSVSTDGESFYGGHETRQDAIHSAKLDGYDEFWVGRSVAPTSPADYWEPEDWLEHVSCSDDYNNDWAEGWERSSKQNRDDLRLFVRTIMQDWLDRHGLNPTFWSVEDSVKYNADGREFSSEH